MRNVMRVGIVAPAILILVSGCATKNWVKDLIGKQRTEVDQRIGTVEGRVGDEGRRIDHESGRVTKVEGRLTEEVQRVDSLGVRVVAVENSAAIATDTAKAARERADAVDGRLTRLWQSRDNRQVVDTRNVHFGFDRWDLDDGALTALQTLVKELKENPRLTVDLIGYTDPTGPRRYNLELSRRRVEAVRRLLVEQGIALRRIHSIGLGPIVDNAKPNAQKRRVTVQLTIPVE